MKAVKDIAAQIVMIFLIKKIFIYYRLLKEL